MLLNIVHLYADKYGWTKDYILNNVYLDEHIINEKIINQQKQQDLDIQTQLTILSVIQDEKASSQILDSLSTMFVSKEQQITQVDKNVTIDETKKQIEEAKRQLANL